MFGNKEERGAYHEIHGKNDEGSMIIVGKPEKTCEDRVKMYDWI